jgi:hypothetical protein
MAQQSSPDVDQILSTIRQVESSNNYGAQAKGSSASGAYQFIDSTWQASTKKAGLGTEYSRAKDAPPEVQDAVAAFAVRDILNRTGNDVTKVPLVWYTGNPEGRMTEDALRANQGLTPDKYQQKWLSVLGGGAPAPTKTAQAPRTTAQGPKQVGARVAAAFNPRDLPSSYTSALALNYLADTDPEGLTMSKVNEMLTEMIEDGGGAAKPAGGKILQQFAQAKSVDPFQFVLQEEKPKQRAVPRMPKMFADGGLVAAAANLQRPILKPEEKEFLAAREKEFAGYISQAEKYNEALDNYQKQYDAYEESMKGNPDYEAYLKAAEDYNTKVDNYNKLLDSYAIDPKGRRVTMSNYAYGNVYVTSYPGSGEQVWQDHAWDYNPINLPESSFIAEYPGQTRWVLPSGWQWVPINPGQTGYQAIGYLKKTGVSDPFESFTQRTAPTLEAKAPGSPPAEFKMKAPTPPTGLKYTWDQVQEYQNNAMTRAAKAARNRATALQVITGQGPYAGFGLSLFADGGEVGEQYESLEDVMAAAPTQDAEQRQWEQEIPVRELTRQLNETVDRYRAGRASEADLKQFFPNYSDYDIANMFGMTDAGQSGPRPEITAQPFLTPEVYDRAMNRGRMEEYNVEREIREKSPNIYPNKRDFTLRLQQLADGGEVNYDQMAEQMTVGTLLPPEQYIPTPMVRPGVSVPTMSEVPRVDAKGRVIREAPTPDQVYTPGQKIIGGAEALGATLSGLTAPASILYDVARGVPAKEISPGRFMYEPRTEAGQEYTQNIGRLAQDLKLDAALPQVQLQRPYPVGAMARQAADIATGPIDRAKIRAAASRVPEDVAYDPLRERLESQGILSLAVKPGKEIDYSLLRPGENAPFVGELERIVADLPGPVRLQEFVNRVNKTARGYEKDRLDEFVERIKNTSSQPIDQIKLTPQQILDGLKETSPKRFLSKIIEPTERNQTLFWSSQDNPLPNNKVGTINLNLEVAPQISALSKKLDELNIASDQLTKVRSWSYVSDADDAQSSEWKRSTDQIKAALNEVSDFDPTYANRINESITYADEIIKFSPKFSKARHDLIYPILSDEYRAWRSSKNFSSKEINKVQDKIRNNALENLRLLFEEAERREFISPLGVQPTSNPLFITFPTFIKMIKSFDEKTKNMGASTPEDLEKVRKSLVEISNGYVTQVERNKQAMLMSLQNQLEDFADIIKKQNARFIYPGQHTSIEQNNPISFSRFVDLTPEQITSFNIPLKDNNRGAMLVMELQSDRFDANRPTIVKKDPRTGQVTSERPNPEYKKEVEEAYPGMGKSGQVIQQLMIKNAIYGAMKRGKGLLLFPGTDSAKANLYEKLGPNLKQVIKDLGPGFEMKQFTFPGKGGGNATRFGVYIDEDAAKRVMTQGMRFAKGGMVDKPLYDRAV